ncbi:HAD family hydrolase [Silvanigrella aquatica]|uniref:phosphoglycolate phosphatase n=1 Tax=Silvanigrella aquatica TaxID=1915309 RepID=A0A1L4D307_9BACT|nr:HAD hydrolase-like protein [Silvanigrella aquatica]APJ04579.1 hypothetical protein AXG55_11950 [Silvanigrella aquatica]
MYRHIFLDFDGVIVDSTKLKHDTFISLVEDEKKGMDSILDNLLKNKLIGAERNIICKWIIENTDSDKSIEKLTYKFAKKIDRKILELNLTEGFKEFINSIKNKNYTNLSIISNAPMNDIISYLNFFSISNEFTYIVGFEEGISKADRIFRIMNKIILSSDECLFIGDTPSDFLAAKKCNISFIRIESFLGNNCLWDEKILTCKNFFEIINLIERRKINL